MCSYANEVLLQRLRENLGGVGKISQLWWSWFGWPGDGAVQAPPMWLGQLENELTGGELPHLAISAAQTA